MGRRQEALRRRRLLEVINRSFGGQVGGILRNEVPL
jgi:hypothetical protein